MSLAGNVRELQAMFRARECFAIAYYDSARALITLGGANIYEDFYLTAVSLYSIIRNEWKSLPSYPTAVAGSALCIIDGCWVYNIGRTGKLS